MSGTERRSRRGLRLRKSREQRGETGYLSVALVAPARELALADLSLNGAEHTTQIRFLKAGASRYFVGDLALREGRVASFTLEREKCLHPNHDALLLTAVGLLLGKTARSLSLNVAVGLPIDYYRRQRDGLRRRLNDLAASVSVNGADPVWVQFSTVLVYPQGAGLLLTVSNLPDSGMVGIVDVGYNNICNRFFQTVVVESSFNDDFFDKSLDYFSLCFECYGLFQFFFEG